MVVPSAQAAAKAVRRLIRVLRIISPVRKEISDLKDSSAQSADF
jgi:hypothetical protein